MKILLDTNFLLIPAQFKVDIFSEFERIVPGRVELFILDKSIVELKGIVTGKNQKFKHKLAASLALQLVKAKKVRVLPTKEDLDVDSLLVKSKGFVVATQDIGLKRRLKKAGIKIVALRSKKHLVFLD